jgi:hypothetical protein
MRHKAVQRALTRLFVPKVRYRGFPVTPPSIIKADETRQFFSSKASHEAEASSDSLGDEYFISPMNSISLERHTSTLLGSGYGLVVWNNQDFEFVPGGNPRIDPHIYGQLISALDGSPYKDKFIMSSPSVYQ